MEPSTRQFLYGLSSHRLVSSYLVERWFPIHVCTRRSSRLKRGWQATYQSSRALRAQPLQQNLASRPPERVTPARPFARGLGLRGPFPSIGGERPWVTDNEGICDSVRLVCYQGHTSRISRRSYYRRPHGSFDPLLHSTHVY